MFFSKPAESQRVRPIRSPSISVSRYDGLKAAADSEVEGWSSAELGLSSADGTWPR